MSQRSASPWSTANEADVILYAASWGASAACTTAMTEALAEVARTFPALETQSVAGTSWGGSAHVGWICSPGVGTSVAFAPGRLSIVEGVAVRRRGGVLSADDLSELAAADSSLDELHDTEGQFVVLDATLDRLTVQNDAIGVLPVYVTHRGDAWFVANRVEVLARIIGDTGVDMSAASTFLSVGWATGTRTLSPNVEVVSPGTRWTWRTGRPPEMRSVSAPSSLVQRHRSRFDVADLADELVHRCQAVARWAGDVDAPITAGLDSRLLMALLRAGGVEATYYTAGREESADVRAARELAQLTGVTHVVRAPPDHAVIDHWWSSARRAVSQNDGMVNLWQVADTIPTERRPTLIFWGVGGEIGRAFYTRADYFAPRPHAAMLARFVSQRARNFGGLLQPAAVECSRAAVREVVDQALTWGFDPIDVPDVFYTFERITRWAGANARKLPWTTMYAPLATTTFASVAFSLPAISRYSAPLHWNLLRHLAPDLHAYPVAKGGWRTQVPYANLSQSLYRRARRSAVGAEAPNPRLDWLESLRADLATRCLDRSESALWDVVDREAFASVMLDADTLPTRRRVAETLFGIVTLFEYEQMRSTVA